MDHQFTNQSNNMTNFKTSSYVSHYMEKEAFLHQLEYAVTNNDKKLFINIIYNLTPDIIISFTEEELSRIVNISRQINLYDVDEFFEFLVSEGTLFFGYAFERKDELNNSFLGRFYYSLCISLYENNKEKVKNVFLIYSIACSLLADMGIESKVNLEKAINLCENVRKTFPKSSETYARTLLREGVSRARLADMGIESKENLEIAIDLCCVAREILPTTSENYAKALDNESISRQLLAQMGINIMENLEIAIGLCFVAQEIFPKTSEDYAIALVNEGSVRITLADLDIDSKDNLKTAITICCDAQKILPKTSEIYAKALGNEGSARQMLAKMGIDSKENLETAISLCCVCLLYTSPSPRDGLLSRMPSSA